MAAKGTLEVELFGASGLMNTDWFKKSDPYALVTCGDETLRSITARNQGSNPTWNQKLTFCIEEEVKELTMNLYDEDLFTRDDFLGNVSIPLSDTFAKGFMPATAYNVVLSSGEGKGEVQVELKFTPKSSHFEPLKSSINIMGVTT